MAYNIKKPCPDRTFLECRHTAGYQLQQKFKEYSDGANVGKNFHWIKHELSWPSFDDLTFACKDKVFSVLIAYCRTEKISPQDGRIGMRLEFPLGREKAILDACEKNNLIPCAFPIYPDRRQPVLPFGWNLVNMKTHQLIQPNEITTDEKVEESDWELMNWAVMLVKDRLEEQGREIGSFCDVLEVNPQIWFKDANGKPAWVKVAPTRYPDVAKFDRNVIQPQTEKFDGYFAPVSFRNKEENSGRIYRGEVADVEFSILEKVHDAT